MSADADLSSASRTPAPSSTRSFFSRLTSPLKSRTRNLHDFHIKPDEPYKKYSPGDLVRGAVVLEVIKPVRITHLTVCLHGYVRVFKNPNDANQPIPDLGLTASSNPLKSEYFGNGHCSLFQDEQTLCGEGRLEAGVYQFKFELEFPEKGVPSSIDFERGTISYLITATITRPTSINATSSCDTKISLVESVDVGFLTAQKPRTISLEPISRRSKRKIAAKPKESESQDNTDTGSGSETARIGSPLPDESASQCGSMDHQTNSRSPVPSDLQSTVSVATSNDSTASGSTGGVSFRLGPVPSTARSTRYSQNGGSKVSLADQTITATIELLKSGCLPGDNLPIKITIKHVKAIKSMHGIIITLYRQGRIDSAPPLDLFADRKGKEAQRLKHEEYYPKSKTGLGGLSLSSAGSSSMFRKDLAQTFAPILIDPVTLSVVVNASVRVPEDVFPTIRGVPGEMISFKYYVEVVLDLGGKLAGQQRHVPRVGAVAGPAQSSGFRGDGGANMLAAWGGSIVDTENIRREKSVSTCWFELIVGTKDTARVRGRANSARAHISEWSQEAAAIPPAVHEPIYEESIAPSNRHSHNQEQPYPYSEQLYNARYHEYYGDGNDYQEGIYPNYPPPAHDHLPPPVIDDGDLTDKERARRAEERLLPSQPPVGVNDFSSSALGQGSSQPHVEQHDDIYSADDDFSEFSGSIHPLNLVSSERTLGPSAPTLEDLHPSATLEPTEDKQELEHRRLMAEASAPSFPDDDDNAGEGVSSMLPEPSAPPEFAEGYEHIHIPSTREVLPAYER